MLLDRFRPRTLLSLTLVSFVALTGACDSDKKDDKAAKADAKSKPGDDAKAKDVKAPEAKAEADAKADGADAKADEGDAKADGADAKADGADAKAEGGEAAEAGGDEAPAEADAEPTAPVIKDGDLMTGAEKVGGVHQGMAPAEVEKLLGAPAHKGEIEEEAATGDFVQAWSYKDKGLSITMAGTDAKGSGQTVSAITVDATYTGELPWGLKIGSPRADVEKIYGEHFDKDFTNDDQFVAGSIYGGSHYTFKDGKVDGLFVGAGAE